MAATFYERLLDRFTTKWSSEIGQFAGYPSLTNTTPAESDELYIDRGEHYYPYPDFDPKFFYKPDEPLPNYPLKTDHIKLTTEPLKYTNDLAVYSPFLILKLLFLW